MSSGVAGAQNSASLGLKEQVPTVRLSKNARARGTEARKDEYASRTWGPGGY